MLLAGLLLAAVVVLFQASEVGYADYLITSGNPGRMERGAAIFPDDADSWDRLGRYYFLNFADPDPTRATQDFQRAVEIDPLSSHYWIDLASVYESLGDHAKAQEAYQHAREVYPSSAEVAWHYGNFLLRENNSEGYAEIQRAVQGDPSLLPLAISRVWRSSESVDQLLNAIPADTQSLFAALDFFASRRDPTNALLVWHHLMASRETLPLRSSFPFLEALIAEDDSRDASRVWADALAASNVAALKPASNDLISDSGFTADFPNGGLGWRWEPTAGTAINFGPPPSVGTRSIRLDFSGGVNIQLDGPSQVVAVQPSTAYHFHALIRTEEISTDSGMRFLLTDLRHPSEPSLTSDNLTGTHPWTNIDADFKTGPVTHLLLVRLHREPSRLFENRLSGTVWIADVALSENTATENLP